MKPLVASIPTRPGFARDGAGRLRPSLTLSCVIITDPPSQPFYPPRFMHIAIHRSGAEFHRIAPHRRGNLDGEYGSDEELGSRLPQGDEGAPRRGSHRTVRGTRHGAPADAGRPQA